MTTLTLALIALLIAMALTWWLQGAGRTKLIMLDHPGERSLHATPVPRAGGVAIAVGLLPSLLFVFFHGDVGPRSILAGWALVFVVSLLDDWRSLPFWVRLPVHLLAATCVVFIPGSLHDPWLAAIAIFWIVWGTNLFNFMDGMDGLAGMMSVIGGSALGGALLINGEVLLSLLVFAPAAACIGFLFFNFPPARIFMGDAGSAPLGFLFAALAVKGVEVAAIPGWLPLLIFLPFIADTTFTLLKRAWKRRPVWKAHREHAYQALVLGGWPVKKVLLAEALMMVLCAVVALVLLRTEFAGWGVLAAAIFLFLFVYSGIIRRYST